MTRILISHSHADQEIASLLVDYLLAALELQPEDILCTSVIGHELPFGKSISELLKTDLNKTTGLIALITENSLSSTWVLFELGFSWATDKLVIPIIGTGLTYNDLPGPLKNYPGIQIGDKNCSHRITAAITQLATKLNLRQETNPRKDVKRDEFIREFRACKAESRDTLKLKQKEIEDLKAQLSKFKLDFQYQKQQLDYEIRYLENLLNKEQINKFKLPFPLKSATNIDYYKLQKLLLEEEWKKADQETALVMSSTRNHLSLFRLAA